ncbi:unnamed protein product [Rotaria socialis]|uniref:Uncharacterized protein n=1 Tax=Rotaria socialis TaxID=392032 RepID=A0A818DHU5_9BILA|nr:unnamed protein product [Rotaria socialis]
MENMGWYHSRWSHPCCRNRFSGGDASMGAGCFLGAIHAIKTGFSARQLQSDIQELSPKLKIANAQIGSIKNELSNMRINQKAIKIRLLANNVSNLLQYYKNMRKNIEDIRQTCARPLANF